MTLILNKEPTPKPDTCPNCGGDDIHQTYSNAIFKPQGFTPFMYWSCNTCEWQSEPWMGDLISYADRDWHLSVEDKS